MNQRMGESTKEPFIDANERRVDQRINKPKGKSTHQSPDVALRSFVRSLIRQFIESPNDAFVDTSIDSLMDWASKKPVGCAKGSRCAITYISRVSAIGWPPMSFDLILPPTPNSRLGAKSFAQ